MAKTSVTMPSPPVVTARGDANPLESLTAISPVSVESTPDTGWFYRRLVIAVGLTAIAFAIPYTDSVVLAVQGSQAPLPTALPVLVILIALGYRTAPRGVADSESNWIIGALVGVGALAGIHLLAHRLPSLANLWQLPNFGAPVWFACVLMVLFGVRHVIRMWPMWLFVLCCASPLPLTLATASLGGSERATSLLTAVAGAVAVLLAGRTMPWAHRAAAALGCLGSSVAIVIGAGPHLPLFVVTVLVGVVSPTVATALLWTTASARARRAEQTWTEPHQHTARALGTLAATAIALAVLNPPAAPAPQLPVVPVDWTDRTTLRSPVAYDFITRYAGADATLVRYSSPGNPALAVDVLTTSTRAALAETADMVWYPTGRPVDFHAVADRHGLPVGSRIAYSDADAATDSSQNDWAVITWEWRAGNDFQRVSVVTSQSVTGDRLPPEPQPLRLVDVSLRPALWVARQQPADAGDVDDSVLERASALARALAEAATAPAGGSDDDA